MMLPLPSDLFCVYVRLKVNLVRACAVVPVHVCIIVPVPPRICDLEVDEEVRLESTFPSHILLTWKRPPVSLCRWRRVQAVCLFTLQWPLLLSPLEMASLLMAARVTRLENDNGSQNRGKEQLPRRNELKVKNIRLRLPVRQFRQGKRGQTASASTSAFKVLLRVKRLVS